MIRFLLSPEQFFSSFLLLPRFCLVASPDDLPPLRRDVVEGNGGEKGGQGKDGKRKAPRGKQGRD